MGWYLILGTIPISVIGLLFDDQIETGARDLTLIAILLIVAGLVLLGAERVAKRDRDIKTVSARDAAIIGVAQACALVPGVSRSGATITAGLLLGLDRAAAARYSFLLSIPAVVLSGLYQLYDYVTGEVSAGVGTGALILATVLAFVSGYAAIAFFLRYLVTHTFTAFVGYRVVLGAVVIALAASGVIH